MDLLSLPWWMLPTVLFVLPVIVALGVAAADTGDADDVSVSAGSGRACEPTASSGSSRATVSST